MAERRRGHGEGSVFQRADGVWVASVDLGLGPDKKRRRRVVYGKTKTEATKKLKQLIAEISQGIDVDPKRITVQEYLQRWLGHIEPNLKRRGFRSYEAIVRLHLVPTIGHVQLAKLAPLQIQQLYADKLSAGLSKTTVHHIHACLRAALNQAVKWQLLQRNPTIATEPPPMTTADPEFLSFEQAQQLMAALDGDDYAPPILLALTTGLRMGEIQGMRWTDIDWDRRTIVIQQTAWYAAGGPVFEERPKSHKMRRVSFPSPMTAILREHRRRQVEQRMAAGPLWHDHGLVFTSRDGRPIRHDTTINRLRAALARAGLPPIRFHDLRHSTASMLIALGTPLKEVSEILGHSTITITANLYGHMLPGAEQRAADRMEAALFPSSKDGGKNARG